jgi:anti-anti-sigma regulatory factor
MEKVLHIDVFAQVGETLNTREAATLLFVCVVENYAKSVVFDFSRVEFMSRSFADQFHKERMKLKEQEGLIIDLKDASESVRKMLLTVESTQNKKNRFYIELPVFRFSNDRIEEYLQAL